MRLFYLFVACLFTGCVTASQPLSIDQTYSHSESKRTREDYIAKGINGMVVAAHPLASQAGQQVLLDGGNAVDAAVAVSFVISVVRPQSTGLGGGGFLLYYDNDQKQTLAYDFREEAPLKASSDMYLDQEGNPKDFVYKGKVIKNASLNGHLAVGVPGLVRGVWDIHKKWGKLPWKRLLQPAIDIARNGFAVYPGLANAIQRRKDVLSHFEDSAKIFLPEGKPLLLGDTLKQEDLAKTIEAISRDGAAIFYEGWIGTQIIAEMKRGQGIMTSQDLVQYKTKLRDPVAGSYHDIRIHSMPPPSSGGVHIAQILNILEGYSLDAYDFQSPEYINLLAEAMRYAYADRATHLGDPDFVNVPISGLVSKDYAAEIRNKIKPGHAGDSSKIGPGNPTPYESPSTTHFSIVDSEGHAVSSTQTINISFGSGVVAQGTGIVLNDEMDDFSKKPDTPNAFGLIGGKANMIAPRKRMLSSMSPTMVFDEDNQLIAILGSPGGSRIITATLQSILNRFQFGMSPLDAVHAHRIHHQWLPDILFFEKDGLHPKLQESLGKMGYTTKSSPWSVGDVQAIFKEGDTWIGVSDTRSEGKPFGY